VSEPRLLMSADPVVLDAMMVDRLNEARKKTGFAPISDEDIRMLDFAQQLGVGSRNIGSVPLVKVE
jgi:uncharacterized Fe-S center protein